MIDQRIQDMKELHSHIERREILRNIRKLKTSGRLKEAEELSREWVKKYGRLN